MSVVVFGLVVMEINVSSLYVGCQGARCVGPSLEVQQAEGGESPEERLLLVGVGLRAGGGASWWERWSRTADPCVCRLIMYGCHELRWT